MDDAQEKIAVVARLRPTKPSPNVHHKETEFVVQVPRGSDTVNNQVEEYSFRFARVFGPQATQREVFDVVAKDWQWQDLHHLWGPQGAGHHPASPELPLRGHRRPW